MRTAAEFRRKALHIHNAHDIAVFFSEQRHSAQLLGLLEGHHLDVYGQRLEDFGVDDPLHLSQLLGRYSVEVREVEAHTLVVLIRAGLMHMGAQHFSQSFLQQMRTCMVAHDRVAAVALHRSDDLIACLHHAVQQRTGMHIITLRRLFTGRHRQMRAARRCNHAGIGYLTAALGIERRAVQHHQNAFLRTVVRGHGIRQLIAVGQRHDFGLSLQRAVTQKFCGRSVQRAEQIRRPTGNVTAQTVLACLFPLLLHLGTEAVLIHLNAVLSSDLLGKIQRKAERIVQLERVNARQHAALALGSSLFDVVDEIRQDIQALVDGAGEALLLCGYGLFDIISMLHQLGVGSAVLADDGIAQLGQERARNPQHTAMACGPAQQAAQYVATALVGGQDTVAHHKHGGTDVIGDDTDGNVRRMVAAVGLTRNALHMVQDIVNGIHLEQVSHALHHAGQALQAHARINVGALQARICALAV